MDRNYQCDQSHYVSIVTYDFMDQVNDLLNNVTIFGNLDNFHGTIDMAEPFGNKPPNTVGLVDEINNGKDGFKTQLKCVILWHKESPLWFFLLSVTLIRQDQC